MLLVLSACSSVGAAITARAEMIIPVKISTAPDVSYSTIVHIKHVEILAQC